MLGSDGRGFDSRDRRGFLRMVGGGLAAAAALSAPGQALAALVAPLPGERPSMAGELPPLPRTRPVVASPLSTETRVLSLEGAHTGERLTVPYFDGGRYVPDALSAVKHIMRDHRNDKEHEIDPALLDVLSMLKDRLGSSSPVLIVSAYRSPETNAMLAAQGSGVAKNSYHLYGQAIDIRLKDRSTREIHQAAISLEAGGVGLYGRSDFVHVDTGPVRTW